MGLFKDLYEEHLTYTNWNARGILSSTDNEDELTKRDTECVVFTGRFQPFTRGHAAVVTEMVKSGKVPVVCLVKGGKTSSDKVRNPFSENEQVEMIEASLKALGITAKIVQIGTGYVTNVIEACRIELDLEPVAIYAGGAGDEDNRLAAYQATYEKAQVTLDGEKVPMAEAYDCDIKYVDSTPDGARIGGSDSDKEISGTNARQSLKDDDMKEFTNQTGITDEKLFEKMKAVVGAGVKSTKKDLQAQIDDVKAKQAAHKKGGTPTMEKKIAKLEAELASI